MPAPKGSLVERLLLNEGVANGLIILGSCLFLSSAAPLLLSVATGWGNAAWFLGFYRGWGSLGFLILFFGMLINVTARMVARTPRFAARRVREPRTRWPRLARRAGRLHLQLAMHGLLWSVMAVVLAAAMSALGIDGLAVAFALVLASTAISLNLALASREARARPPVPLRLE